MAAHIFKESPDVDYYVEWSSIVDAPTRTGTRAETLAYLTQETDPYLRPDAPHYPERRLQRADATGTSSLWVEEAGLRDKFPEEGSWEDDDYVYHQDGMLTRANLFELCHRTDANAGADVSDLLTPFEDHPDVVTIQVNTDS